VFAELALIEYDCERRASSVLHATKLSSRTAAVSPNWASRRLKSNDRHQRAAMITMQDMVAAVKRRKHINKQGNVFV
jgi:hypothetical protein